MRRLRFFCASRIFLCRFLSSPLLTSGRGVAIMEAGKPNAERISLDADADAHPCQAHPRIRSAPGERHLRRHPPPRRHLAALRRRRQFVRMARHDLLGRAHAVVGPRVLPAQRRALPRLRQAALRNPAQKRPPHRDGVSLLVLRLCRRVPSRGMERLSLHLGRRALSPLVLLGDPRALPARPAPAPDRGTTSSSPLSSRR